MLSISSAAVLSLTEQKRLADRARRFICRVMKQNIYWANHPPSTAMQVPVT